MPTTFGNLLREKRLAANLSQEALAEAARISLGAVGSYERGVRVAPHRDTVRLLADALALSGPSRTEFENAARRKSVPRASAIPAAVLSNSQPEAASFVGRDNEVNEVIELLHRNRLVTITGPGGIGKTRLVNYVASRLRPSRSEESWLIDFSSISDPLLIENRIASVVNLTFADSENACDALTRGLKARDMLLILDNCEHLLEAIGRVAAAIVGSCPHVSILATSRERLRITAESVYRLSPLATPSEDPPDVARALGFSSIELFVERCRRLDQRFSLTEERISAVAEICRRLDGIPLAIELAAAQLPTLGLSELRNEITIHLESLSGGARDLPPRQRTLRATLDWSFSLLTPEEALLLLRLSVFRGGCTLSAAKAVCSDALLDSNEIVRLMSSLAEKSLVTVDVRNDSSRFSLLESTNAYAREKTFASSDASKTATRHAEWCADFADDAERKIIALSSRAWNARVHPEFGNIYQALDWALTVPGDTVIAGRIVGGLRRFWSGRGRTAELYRLTDVVLESLDAEAHAAVAAGVYLARSTVLPDGFEMIEKATTVREMLGDRYGLLHCYLGLAYFHAYRNEPVELQRIVDRALKITDSLGVARIVPMFLAFRADIDIAAERYVEARATLQYAFDLMEAADVLDCQVILSLAFVEYRLGEIESAARRSENYASAAFAEGEIVSAIGAQNQAAHFWLELDEVEHAADLARSSLIAARAIDNALVAETILTLATVAALNTRSSHAARLVGFAKPRLRERGHDGEAGCSTCDLYERVSKLLSKQLSEAERDRYLREGLALTEELAVLQALRK